ncbi:hypothetical protein U1Q18_001969 [Sarracenia purpurea var. burkii]
MCEFQGAQRGLVEVTRDIDELFCILSFAAAILLALFFWLAGCAVVAACVRWLVGFLVQQFCCLCFAASGWLCNSFAASVLHSFVTTAAVLLPLISLVHLLWCFGIFRLVLLDASGVSSNVLCSSLAMV